MDSWIIWTDLLPDNLSSFSNGIWGASPVAGAQWIWSNGLDQSVAPANNQTTSFRSFRIPCAALVAEQLPVSPLIPTLDHFQCYTPEKIEGSAESADLEVTDQFGEGRIVTGQPVLHCNPSKKVHNGKAFEIQNEKDHLVCYDLRDQTRIEDRRVHVGNQLGEHEYSLIDKRSLFCVPSKKEEI